jgi:hypothetical protein
LTAGHEPRGAGDVDVDVDDSPRDAQEVLTEIVAEWSDQARATRTELRSLEEKRADALTRTHVSPDDARGLDRRREAELAVAVARGAVQALSPLGMSQVSEDIQALKERLVVLSAAEKITTKWVQDQQRKPLERLSEDITTLTRAFGVDQLTSVTLSGRASMDVRMGGKTKPYSECDPGAQLRLKVATAVALLRRGFDTGIGRHPGLLLVDSPGTEEAHKDNLDTMLAALRNATDASPDMQVLVASTASQALEQNIDPANRWIAAPGQYVW